MSDTPLPDDIADEVTEALFRDRTPNTKRLAELAARWPKWAAAIARASLAAGVDLPSPFDSHHPQRVGPYRLLRLLGGGGHGLVYLADQGASSPEAHCAVKVFKAPSTDPEFGARFRIEVLALKALHHPFIVGIRDAGVDRDVMYIAMEHVDGIAIHDYCRHSNASTDDRVRLMAKVCSAIAHAHGRLILHRDLTPRNVLVTAHETEPTPKVVDFGLAKLLAPPMASDLFQTAPAARPGTLPYMAPEQLAPLNFPQLGGVPDARIDVYGLGALLYELVARRPAFALPEDALPDGEAGAHRLIREILETRPPPPSSQAGDVTGVRAREIDAIVLHAMEKDPDRRYPSAIELQRDLERYLHHEPIAAPPPAKLYRLRKFARRHRSVLTVSGLLLLATIAGLWNALASYVAIAELRGVLYLQRLRGDFEALLPLRRDKVAAANRWLEDYHHILRPWIADVTSRSGSGAENGSPDALTSVLARLLRDARQLETGEATYVDRFLRWAEFEARFEQTDTWRDRWNETLAQLRVHPRYAATHFDLAPQEGLWPLGENPVTHLWEFCLLASGWDPSRPPESALASLPRLSDYDRKGNLPTGRDLPIVFVLVPAGSCPIGTPEDGVVVGSRRWPARGETQHSVTLARPFFIAKYETTQWQWVRLGDGSNPSGNQLGRENPDGVVTGNHPVSGLTWIEAFNFCRRLGVTLPTEAQWEFAARAGDGAIFSSTVCNILDQKGIQHGSYDGTPAEWNDNRIACAPVGSFDGNPIGLFDMIGNVWEWCLDEPRDYSGAVDPMTGLRNGAILSPGSRAMRGGGHPEGPLFSRFGARRSAPEATFSRAGGLGFRAARAWE